MSNARSPREVCSTTIGTSGLTVLASFRFERSVPAQLHVGWEPGDSLAISRGRKTRLTASLNLTLAAGSPELTRAAGLLAAGGPQLVPGLRLLDRDRLRGVGDQVERLALRQVLLERLYAPARLQPLQQLLRRRAARPVARGLLDGLHHLVVARLDALGLDDRGQHRLAAQCRLGLGLGAFDDLALVRAGDPHVGLARDALVRERVEHLVPLLAGACLDERVGHVELGVLDDRVERRLAELGLDPRRLGLGDAGADV